MANRKWSHDDRTNECTFILLYWADDPNLCRYPQGMVCQWTMISIMTICHCFAKYWIFWQKLKMADTQKRPKVKSKQLFCYISGFRSHCAKNAHALSCHVFISRHVPSFVSICESLAKISSFKASCVFWCALSCWHYS